MIWKRLPRPLDPLMDHTILMVNYKYKFLTCL